MRVLEGPRKFAQAVYMCFAALEKTYYCVPCGSGALWVYGVDRPTWDVGAGPAHSKPTLTQLGIFTCAE